MTRQHERLQGELDKALDTVLDLLPTDPDERRAALFCGLANAKMELVVASRAWHLAGREKGSPEAAVMIRAHDLVETWQAVVDRAGPMTPLGQQELML